MDYEYSLGIDAGGTYTDAVLLDDSNNSILSANKTFTTYPDPIDGIKNAIDGINQNVLKKVHLVSVSTTLSTNTILEGTGFPVALILIGDHDSREKLPTPYYVEVAGGHDQDGIEKEPLDEAKIRKFAMEVKGKVSAFAISSFFSIRNPEHEEKAKEIVKEIAGYPTICGHELSLDLGAFERATTAFFNAQLIPIAEKFMVAVEKEIKNRHINPKIFMLKCDGSTIFITKALNKPIESIFSGPAGSLVGAAFLSGKETCAVIDVGGTSTDISFIKNGVPEISDYGAVVGGWKTKVKAIRMETSAMGGDSQICIKDSSINIGPRRAIPLCRAANVFPKFLKKLQVNSIPSKLLLNNVIQPVTFYVKSGYKPLELTDLEKSVFDAISDEPTSLNEIRSRLNNRYPSKNILEKLLQKRLILPVAFTPTDALHVLGDYTEYNIEASHIGASVLGSMCMKNSLDFAKMVKQQFSLNMASRLVSFFYNTTPEKEIRRMFDMNVPVKFKIGIPVVLIGGPVVAYKKELGDILDTDIILPEYANVGNAAGALAAKGIRRIDFLVRPVSMIAPGGATDVFSQHGKKRLITYEDAIRYAEEEGKNLITKYMEESGFDPNHVEINLVNDEIIPKGYEFPIQTYIRVLGVGTHVNIIGSHLTDEEIK